MLPKLRFSLLGGSWTFVRLKADETASTSTHAATRLVVFPPNEATGISVFGSIQDTGVTWVMSELEEDQIISEAEARAILATNFDICLSKAQEKLAKIYASNPEV